MQGVQWFCVTYARTDFYMNEVDLRILEGGYSVQFLLGSVRDDGELWSQFLDTSLVTRSNL